MTSNIELERTSLEDLKKLVEEAKEWDLKLVLIGGYAIRAYTKPRRFTKDLDFVTLRGGLGQMKGFLHYMNYQYKSGEFWLAFQSWVAWLRWLAGYSWASLFWWLFLTLQLVHNDTYSFGEAEFWVLCGC